MTWTGADRVYELLPAVYRLRDHEQGEPLRALLAVIQAELETLEADVHGLYDNWFVETAAEWLLPYIGDLLGVTNLHTIESAGVYSLRAYVANTLLYRQRKGTASVLEQLADDITGWEARVVEFFQLLATTQHLNHVRLHNVRTPNLRDSNALELIDSPFDEVAHTGEVRRIDPRQGRYNIPNVGLYLWRLQAYPLRDCTPRDAGSGRFRFHPVGLDAPIFNRPKSEPGVSHLAREINVPGPVRRRAMADDPGLYLGSTEPVLTVHWDGAGEPLKPEAMRICHLGEWDDPGWIPPASDGTERVAVDPALGRLVVLTHPGFDPPTSLQTGYTYGFSGDVGGGPYDRNETVERKLAGRWVRRVRQDGSADFTSLSAAVDAWNSRAGADLALTKGVIAITDSRTYVGDLTGSEAIEIPSGHELLIVASEPFDPVSQARFDARSTRPHLLGNVSIRGTAAAGDPNPGRLILDGLLIEGVVRVLQGSLGWLTVRHCTIVPQPEALIAPSQSNRRLHVELMRSICGGINLAPTVPFLTVVESIVDNRDGPDVQAPGAEATVNGSTILGEDDDLAAGPTMRILHASESIFTGRLHIERRQAGCVRFCHVAPDSRTGQRYRCQPDLALASVSDPARRDAIVIQLRPQFTSTHYGDPAYVQLSRACATEIRTGAENGAEMGVFAFLQQPQREANLRAVLDEYLPFGMQAGIFYVT